MKRVSYLLVLVTALIAAPLFAGAASAHVEVNPSKAPAGKPANLAFEIGHGCDGAATTSLVVQIPPSVRDVSAKPVQGWKVRKSPGRLVWTGGPLGDHDVQEYPFTATFYGKKGKRVLLKAIQRCEGGVETAWIQASGGASETENPAPAVTLTSTAAVPVDQSQAGDDQTAEEGAEATGEPTATSGNPDDSSGDDEGTSGKSLLLIIVAGLAIGTIAGIIVRARRQK